MVQIKLKMLFGAKKIAPEQFKYNSKKTDRPKANNNPKMGMILSNAAKTCRLL
jgi:hypothetical protein